MNTEIKVNDTPKTFKVLVTSDSERRGDIIEVSDFNETCFFSQAGLVNKLCCHVIEPAWKVMRDAEVTGREVEVWMGNKWKLKIASYWFPSEIYRLAPEPKAPEYVPYTFEDADKLRGLWIQEKGKNNQQMIISLTDGYANGLSFQELLDDYETLDNSPIGKIKQ